MSLDSLRTGYDAEVDFYPGESPTDVKFDNWAAMILAAVNNLAAGVGDLTHYYKINPVPPFVVSVKQSLGNMDNISPQLQIKKNAITGEWDTTYTVTLTTANQGIKEIELPYLPEDADGIENIIIASDDNNFIDPAGYAAPDAMTTTAGCWTVVQVDGSNTKKLVTHLGADVPINGLSFTYRCKAEHVLQSDDSYVNLIPTYNQLQALGSFLEPISVDVDANPVGYRISVEAVTIGGSISGYKLTLPYQIVQPNNTGTYDTTPSTDVIQAGLRGQYSLPDWLYNLVVDGSALVAEDPFPTGLFLLWDQSESKILLDSNDSFPTFYKGNNANEILFSAPGLELEEMGDGVTGLGIAGNPRYSLLLPGLSIARGLQLVKDNLEAQDHSLVGQLIPHSALKELLPAIDPTDPAKYGLSTLPVNHHPVYLHRDGYQTDTINTNNSMHGDFHLGSSVNSGTDTAPNYSNDGARSHRIQFGGDAPSGARIWGRKVTEGTKTEYRIQVDADLDGEATAKGHAPALRDFHGANFLPDIIVTGRPHAPTVSGGLPNAWVGGARVFNSLAEAVTFATNNSHARKIYLEPGTHNVTTALTLPPNGVIYGAGKASKITCASGFTLFTTCAANAASYSNLFKDFSIEVSGTTLCTAISVENNYTILENIWIERTSSAVINITATSDSEFLWVNKLVGNNVGIISSADYLNLDDSYLGSTTINNGVANISGGVFGLLRVESGASIVLTDAFVTELDGGTNIPTGPTLTLIENCNINTLDFANRFYAKINNCSIGAIGGDFWDANPNLTGISISNTVFLSSVDLGTIDEAVLTNIKCYTGSVYSTLTLNGDNLQLDNITCRGFVHSAGDYGQFSNFIFNYGSLIASAISIAGNYHNITNWERINGYNKLTLSGDNLKVTGVNFPAISLSSTNDSHYSNLDAVTAIDVTGGSNVNISNFQTGTLTITATYSNISNGQVTTILNNTGTNNNFTNIEIADLDGSGKKCNFTNCTITVVASPGSIYIKDGTIMNSCRFVTGDGAVRLESNTKLIGCIGTIPTFGPALTSIGAERYNITLEGCRLNAVALAQSADNFFPYNIMINDCWITSIDTFAADEVRISNSQIGGFCDINSSSNDIQISNCRINVDQISWDLEGTNIQINNCHIYGLINLQLSRAGNSDVTLNFSLSGSKLEGDIILGNMGTTGEKAYKNIRITNNDIHGYIMLASQSGSTADGLKVGNGVISNNLVRSYASVNEGVGNVERSIVIVESAGGNDCACYDVTIIGNILDRTIGSGSSTRIIEHNIENASF